ncbi:hypothetical protein [Azotobacter armeniacus]
MEQILEKLSSYNIFNYLFPGVVFCVIADQYLSLPLLQDSIINGLFLYYFIGLIISRFGSLILEPLLKKIGIVKFADHSDFISAAAKDPKLEILSETNNMYRTVLSALVILCVLLIGKHLIAESQNFSTFSKYALLPALAVLFCLSYKKQTEYIAKRISASKNP